MDYSEIVNKLIGPIQPVGESHIDVDRYGNLKEMCCLVEGLLGQISRVASERNRHEHSIKECGLYAHTFLIDKASEIMETNS